MQEPRQQPPAPAPDPDVRSSRSGVGLSAAWPAGQERAPSPAGPAHEPDKDGLERDLQKMLEQAVPGVETVISEVIQPAVAQIARLVEQQRRRRGTYYWFWQKTVVHTGGQQVDILVPYSIDFSQQLSVAFLSDRQGSMPRVPTPCGRWYVICESAPGKLAAHGRVAPEKVAFTQLPTVQGGQAAGHDGVCIVKCEPPQCYSHCTANALAWFAATRGRLELLCVALDNHADPDFRGPVFARSALLHAAARSGKLSCVRLLLSRGADIHAHDAEGHTAMSLLHRAGSSCVPMLRELHETVCARRASRPPQPHTDLVGWKVRCDGGTVHPGSSFVAIVYARHSKREQEGFFGTKKKPLCRPGWHLAAFVLQGDWVCRECRTVNSACRSQGSGPEHKQGSFLVPSPPSWHCQSCKEQPESPVCRRQELNFSSRSWRKLRLATRAELEIAASELDPVDRAHCAEQWPTQSESELDSIDAELKSECARIEQRLSTDQDPPSTDKSTELLNAALNAAMACSTAAETQDWELRRNAQRIEAVRARADAARRCERMRREDSQGGTLELAKQQASELLRTGKDAMASQDFERAEKLFEASLIGYRDMDGLSKLVSCRWDADQWLTVAQIRKHLASTPPDFSAAAELLDQTRDIVLNLHTRKFPNLGATLDVAGGDGLIEAFREAQEVMQDTMNALFQQRTETVTAWSSKTTAAAETVSQITHLLTKSVEALVQRETANGGWDLSPPEREAHHRAAMDATKQAFMMSAQAMQTVNRQPTLHNVACSLPALHCRH
eukprot:COSAG01_NODE_6643_length_3566_cov_20.896164_1_plen_783_part_10